MLAVVQHASTDCLDNIALNFLIEFSKQEFAEIQVFNDELIVMTRVQIVPVAAAGPVTGELSRGRVEDAHINVFAIRQGQLVQVNSYKPSQLGRASVLQ